MSKKLYIFSCVFIFLIQSSVKDQPPVCKDEYKKKHTLGKLIINPDWEKIHKRSFLECLELEFSKYQEQSKTNRGYAALAELIQKYVKENYPDFFSFKNIIIGGCPKSIFKDSGFLNFNWDRDIKPSYIKCLKEQLREAYLGNNKSKIEEIEKELKENFSDLYEKILVSAKL